MESMNNCLSHLSIYFFKIYEDCELIKISFKIKKEDASSAVSDESRLLLMSLSFALSEAV